MELTRLVTYKLDNGDVRFIGYKEKDIMLMHDINSDLQEKIIEKLSSYPTYRVEFIFSRGFELKLFNPQNEQEYPKYTGSPVCLKGKGNYYSDSLYYFITDAKSAMKLF